MSARATSRPPSPLDQWIRDVATVVGLRPTAPIFAPRSGPRWPQPADRDGAEATRAEPKTPAAMERFEDHAGGGAEVRTSERVSPHDEEAPSRPLRSKRLRSEASPTPSIRPRHHAVEIRLRGETYELVVDDGQTLLEAARQEGVDLPFSCASGGCGACRVHLLEGDYEIDEPNCLSGDERAQGFVLACVGRPRSACRVEADA